MDNRASAETLRRRQYLKLSLSGVVERGIVAGSAAGDIATQAAELVQRELSPQVGGDVDGGAVGYLRSMRVGGHLVRHVGRVYSEVQTRRQVVESRTEVLCGEGKR